MTQLSGEPTILANLTIVVARAPEVFGRDGIAAVTEVGIDYGAGAKSDAHISARQKGRYHASRLISRKIHL